MQLELFGESTANQSAFKLLNFELFKSHAFAEKRA